MRSRHVSLLTVAAVVLTAVVGAFAQFPPRDQDRAVLDAAAGQAAAAEAAMMVTREPHNGRDAVDDAAMERLTGWLTSWNHRGGPVLVRYAHEMNGSWYPWGQQPDAYVDWVGLTLYHFGDMPRGTATSGQTGASS